MVPRFLLFAFQSGGRRSAVSITTKLPSRSFSSVSSLAEDSDDIPQRRFQEIPELHPLLKANIVHDAMTEIQARTYDSASKGLDVLGRARTGTGKTVGFLLPALQRLLSDPTDKSALVRLLVLSPTRELAAQIDTQVQSLIKKTGLTHQVVFGGSHKGGDINLFERRVPNVLVATPGRLKDHLQTTRVRGKDFSALLKHLDILVLDETDRYVLAIPLRYWKLL